MGRRWKGWNIGRKLVVLGGVRRGEHSHRQLPVIGTARISSVLALGITLKYGRGIDRSYLVVWTNLQSRTPLFQNHNHCLNGQVRGFSITNE